MKKRDIVGNNLDSTSKVTMTFLITSIWAIPVLENLIFKATALLSIVLLCNVAVVLLSFALHTVGHL